jgi:carbamoyl-phosphate synthase large subunit
MTDRRRNVLLLSAGRRVSLARLLCGAAGRVGGRLITADMRPDLSAACMDNGESATLPRVTDPAYADALKTLCETREIGVVFPTIDTELAVLADLRPALKAAGTEVVVCDAALIAAARDKRLTAAFFGAMGVPSPGLMLPDAMRYPAFAKPFDGSLSRDVTLLKGPGDLTEKVLTTPNVMFADYLDHADHQEFTCDAYYTSTGKLCCIVPRQRLEVRGGEVSKARAVRNEIVDLFARQLGQLNGARGCLTFQFFRHKETAKLWLIELNPRFGGGYPLTAAAGAAYHDWAVREYLTGQVPEPCGDWQDGLTMLRFDAEVFTRGT